MNFVKIHQLIEFLPTSVSHDHQVYIIVTANRLRFLTYLLSRVEYIAAIWPSQQFCHGAPCAGNTKSVLISTFRPLQWGQRLGNFGGIDRRKGEGILGTESPSGVQGRIPNRRSSG